MHYVFPREIMTNTNKVIFKNISSKKQLIEKDLQEAKKIICPEFQQAAEKIPAQKTGVKQHSLKLT